MKPLEQKMGDPVASATNPQLAERQRRAIELARYAHNPIFNPLETILSNAELYLQGPDRNDLMESSYNLLKKFEYFYSEDNIPYRTMHRKEEFYHLFTVRDLLFELRETMDKVFGEKSANSLKELNVYVNSIILIERLYFRSLMKLLGQIRIYPEAADFMVTVRDRDNGIECHF
ncbi:hypothetical protein HYT53_01040 [Candidatus Woesearchaeota archaeon]|nr:hypothetical protein [Candidatus Woesearchaeota archaeon]